jgi:ribosomal protein S2
MALTLVIPGNDDAIRAIQLYAGSMADAILKAKNMQLLKQVDVAKQKLLLLKLLLKQLLNLH